MPMKRAALRTLAPFAYLWSRVILGLDVSREWYAAQSPLTQWVASWGCTLVAAPVVVVVVATAGSVVLELAVQP